MISLAKIARDGDLLESIKPTVIKNDIQSDFAVKQDKVDLTCDRFRTRIRVSRNQVCSFGVAQWYRCNTLQRSFG